MNTRACIVLVLAMAGALPGCESTKIAVKEMVGIPKRDQLVARVKSVNGIAPCNLGTLRLVPVK